MDEEEWDAISKIIKKSTKTITNEYGSEKYLQLDIFSKRLADYLEQENPPKYCEAEIFDGFNRKVFLKKVGVEE